MTRDIVTSQEPAESHRTRHPIEGSVSPTVSVATALAAVRGESPTDLDPPLAAVIDTDELAAVFDDEPTEEPFAFEYEDCSVRVHGDGRIVVTRDRARAESERAIPEAVRDLVADRYVPGTAAEQERRRGAMIAAYEYLREQGSAQKREFISEVYPDRPAAYSIPDGGWWESIVKPCLEDCPDVSKGGGRWYYVGDL